MTEIKKKRNEVGRKVKNTLKRENKKVKQLEERRSERRRLSVGRKT